MSLFEWIGEMFSRGSYGTIELGHEPVEREPFYLVLLKFVLSATLILLIDFLVFSYLVAPTPWTFAIASGCHVIYFLLGYLVRPVPDESNLGLFGSILNDPLSVSDDINRSLLWLQILLLPGRFVSEAFVYFIATVCGLRGASRRDSAVRLPAIAVPRGFRRAVTLLAWGVLCVGSALIAHQIWSDGIETDAWQSVEARVIERWTEGERATLADAKMKIEYEFNGETFRTVQHGYSPDDRTTVFIDPMKPTRVSLHSGVSWPKFVAFVGLSAVGGLGLFAWLALTVWPQLASDDYHHAERD